MSELWWLDMLCLACGKDRLSLRTAYMDKPELFCPRCGFVVDVLRANDISTLKGRKQYVLERAIEFKKEIQRKTYDNIKDRYDG